MFPPPRYKTKSKEGFADSRSMYLPVWCSVHPPRKNKDHCDGTILNLFGVFSIIITI